MSGRGLYSSLFRLNLSHFVTKVILRIPQKVLTLRRIVDECQPLAGVRPCQRLSSRTLT